MEMHLQQVNRAGIMSPSSTGTGFGCGISRALKHPLPVRYHGDHVE
jgi:hypothetical protein